MALLKIARLGNPKIRHGAKLVSLDELQSPDIQKFIQDLVDTMRDGNSVSISFTIRTVFANLESPNSAR